MNVIYDPLRSKEDYRALEFEVTTRAITQQSVRTFSLSTKIEMLPTYVLL